MKSRLLIILFFYIHLNSGTFAQKQQSDSLNTLLKEAKSDSEKIKLYIKFSEIVRAYNLPASVSYGHKAAGLAQESNWSEGKAMAHEALAFSYFELKKTDSSIYFANSAASAYQQLQKLKAKAIMLVLLGKKLLSVQKYAEAKNYFTQALETNRELSDFNGELGVLEDMGWLYHHIGNYDVSNKQFEKAYTLALKLKDTKALAHLNAAFANNYIAIRNYALAQRKYFESAKYFKKQGDLNSYSLYLASAANLYRRLNQLKKAKEPLLEAYKIAKQNNYSWNICTIARYLGMLYTDLEEYYVAESYLIESNQVAKKLNSNPEIIKAYYAFERLYYLQKDLANGDRYQKLIISMRDSLYNAESSAQLAKFDIRYKTAEKEKLLAHTQLEIARKQNLIFGISIALIIVMSASVAIWYIQKIKHEADVKGLSLQHAQIELKTREQERQRIAKDLHDSLGSQLTIVSTNLDNACFLVEKNCLTSEKLEAINANVREAVQSLRDTIWATNTTIIRASMLYARMQQYLLKIFSEQEHIIYQATFLGDDKDLNAIEALNLFRIFQESIQNILKHAQADKIHLTFESSANSLKLLIADNGIGFDTSANPFYETFGLLNMKIRSEEIKADLKITSVVNQGTEIVVVKNDNYRRSTLTQR
ncbi:tetratricopeptide repeat-containing sensor histidine kinase [Emticicia sp. BO119]|uniref:tetratricopeptide repeat-containing sensor histidine kinase n=1 Tax=Emticicia sp. BO119 TaxID=2757768 RepID=UPI0015F0D0FF|nr:tetratricopeptide repeat-containing sensor histidine kinase [Emticicia sp. BO119]MBA4852551.1 hypothetical protein [Emticicia sp. BO119]